MQEELVDRVYEAAFIPELWPDVLGRIARYADAASGELQIFNGQRAPVFKATPATDALLADFIAQGTWRLCEKPALWVKADHAGFLRDADFMTQDQLERDPANRLLAQIGLGRQIGSMLSLPTGDVACFTFERSLSAEYPDQATVDALDALRPHLARAALIAARLGLEQARAVVEALGAVGLPAAVLDSSGKVITTNTLLEATEEFAAAAFGGVTLLDPRADALLRAAIRESGTERTPSVRSIPVAAREGGMATVVHVLPLRRNAQDLFAGADLLLAVTALNPKAMVPSPTILSALFDLTPSEARLAAGLAEGGVLKEVGASMNVTYATARTYLDRIFLKTGVRKQSELVALLKGVHPVR